MKKETPQAIARNKKAYAFFEIIETLEAGIVLTGAETKSAKSGKVNLKGSFITIKNTTPALKKTKTVEPKRPVLEAWAENIHISPYKYDHSPITSNPTRSRKILLHRKEIDRMIGYQNNKGHTILPLELYLKKGLIKVLIGLARGKKKYDRRLELKKKAQDQEIKRTLKMRMAK